MKASNFVKFIGLILFSVLTAAFAGPVIAEAFNLDVSTTIILTGSVVFLSGFIPKGDHGFALYAEAPDVSAITTTFVKYGGDVIKKAVNKLSVASDPFFKFYRNVTAPLPLPKFGAAGEPRPYRADNDTTNNDIDITDRVLSVYASKWDIDFDYEKFHNTYLASLDERPYENVMLEQLADEYWGQLNDYVIWAGNLDAAGSDVEDICDGWGQHILDDIAGAAAITVIATGAVDGSNSVTKHEQMLASIPAWARESGKVEALMSYTQFDYYKTHYRDTFGYTYQPRNDGFFYLDNTNIRIRPISMLGTNNRITYTVAGNLCWGVKGDNIKVYASQRRNIIEVRPMIHIGTQIADLAKIWVNDQT